MFVREGVTAEQSCKQNFRENFQQEESGKLPTRKLVGKVKERLERLFPSLPGSGRDLWHGGGNQQMQKFGTA